MNGPMNKTKQCTNTKSNKEDHNTLQEYRGPNTPIHNKQWDSVTLIQKFDMGQYMIYKGFFFAGFVMVLKSDGHFTTSYFDIGRSNALSISESPTQQYKVF